MQQKFSTALIGFGKMASGYASDSAMARFYPYATHAQVLRDHPAFDWKIVVDPNPSACNNARDEWMVPMVVSSLDELEDATSCIEVVVVATPPDCRFEILDKFPNVKAVLVEKPLGTDLASSNKFIDECDRRGILVQVNFWRRADKEFRALADGKLRELVGNVQSVFGVYGNGLHNNGIHMIDMVRMLIGDTKTVQRINVLKSFREGPILNDANCAFAMETEQGIPAVFLPVSFSHYRENGLSIWGERGRLDILNEGLCIQYYERTNNRGMLGEYEVSADKPILLSSTVGHALFEMYSNLADTLYGVDKLWSSGVSGLRTTKIVDIIAMSPDCGQLCEV